MHALQLAVSTAIEAALQLGPLALAGLLYARRVHTLAGAGRPVPGWRQACFYGGFVTIAAALTSLGSASQDLLYMHMIEHLLLGDIAALLIVLGLTGPLHRADPQIKLFDRLRALSTPRRLPAVGDRPVRLAPARLLPGGAAPRGRARLEHAMFLAFGVNMWMCLFGPLPTPSGSATSAVSATSSRCASPAPCSATSSCGRAQSSTPFTAAATRSSTSPRWPIRTSPARS